MKTLACNCGFEAKGEDRYQVEAKMWRHAIEDHEDMLKGMTEDQLADWLRNKDAALA